MRKLGVYWASDLVDTTGAIRTGVIDTAAPEVRSALTQQLREYMMTDKVDLRGQSGRIFPN